MDLNLLKSFQSTSIIVKTRIEESKQIYSKNFENPQNSVSRLAGIVV